MKLDPRRIRVKPAGADGIDPAWFPISSKKIGGEPATPPKMKPKYEDFIGLYEGAVDSDFCNWICRYVDNSSHVAPRNFMQVKQIA